MRQSARAVLLTLLTGWPGSAWCQPPVARADLLGSIGSFTSNRTETPEVIFYDRWPDTVIGTLGAGVYWTDHVKTEGEIAWTGTAVTFGFQPIDVPGAPGSGVPVERSYRTFKMSASQLYQFRRNQLFHPFVGGGIDVDREVRRFERREQRIQLYGPGGRLDAVIAVPPEFESTTDYIVRPFAAGGFKAYFNERAFFRTELKVQFGQRIEQVIWKAGLGIDL